MPKKNLTRAAAREALVKLSNHFGVAVPHLRWSKYYRGFYNKKTQTISAGRKCRAGTQDALLHEFAHHLNVQRGDNSYRHHGLPFVLCLVEITTYWYGDPRDYSWEEEYPTVEKIAVALLNAEVTN